MIAMTTKSSIRGKTRRSRQRFIDGPPANGKRLERTLEGALLVSAPRTCTQFQFRGRDGMNDTTARRDPSHRLANQVAENSVGSVESGERASVPSVRGA